jgi:hypothetical protein
MDILSLFDEATNKKFTARLFSRLENVKRAGRGMFFHSPALRVFCRGIESRMNMD